MTTTQSLNTTVSYYLQPGAMTDPGEYVDLLRALPEDVPALVKIVQGLMLHVFWADRYGVQLSDERKAEVQIRPVRRKLAHLLEIDSRPLIEARPPELRLVGNCRDFSVMMVSILKARGIPARARCGFGTYFIPGHYEDHWVFEYWDASQERWIQGDAQLDDLQQNVLGIQFNTLDMPAGQFVMGGLAWQLCREGKANPDDFGIFDMKGWDFVKNDLLLDLRSLNRVELLPWDVAGWALVAKDEMTPDQLALLDRAAALTLAGNESFQEMRDLYEQNQGFHFPEEWLQ